MKVTDFKRKKEQHKKISMLTCYDYPSARIIADSAIDCVLVGDSVAMAVHGHPTTLMATVDMMVLHTSAVSRALSTQFLITDLPFLAHRMGLSKTIKHVQQLMQAGAHAIKIEGADADTLKTIEYIVQSGVPVMGHIGLMPQSVHQLGGYKVQGKTETQVHQLIQQAQALEAVGCFAIVLECIQETLAQRITETLQIPTIGIGAGRAVDGQVLVWHDLLGLNPQLHLRFVKQFLPGYTLLLNAINAYAEQVQQQQFPTLDHAF